MMRECHRFLIGFEEAEAKAERERSLGWEVGVVDPNVSPGDYHWRIAGDDAVCFAINPITYEFARRLGTCLIERGARTVGIFNSEGNCVFGHFPDTKTEKDIEMSKKQSLVGQRFHKYDMRADIEEFHVLDYDEITRKYLVAVVYPPERLDETKAGSIGASTGRVAYIQDTLVEHFATQDQEKIKRLMKLEAKRRALIREIAVGMSPGRFEEGSQFLVCDDLPPF